MIEMDRKLCISAFSKFAAGVILTGALLFIPAGTLHWERGWLFMAVLFIPMFIAGLVMMTRAPDLLRKRLNAREEEYQQKAVIAASGLMFIAAFVVAGLGQRFGWPTLPVWVSVLGAGVFLAGYALFAEVLRENEFVSRTVEVLEGQRVVDTGLYSYVRHPMYSATLAIFLAMPVILGSPASCVIMCTYIPIIVARIHNEEELLAEQLDGYRAYMKKVPWRLIPHVW